jgi:hypothetical protein
MATAATGGACRRYRAGSVVPRQRCVAVRDRTESGGGRRYKRSLAHCRGAPGPGNIFPRVSGEPVGPPRIDVSATFRAFSRDLAPDVRHRGSKYENRNPEDGHSLRLSVRLVSIGRKSGSKLPHSQSGLRPQQLRSMIFLCGGVGRAGNGDRNSCCGQRR